MRVLTVSSLVLLAGAALAQANTLDISIAAQGAGYNTMVRDAKLRGDGGLDNANLGNTSGGSNRFYADFLADNTTPTTRKTHVVQWFDVSSIPSGAIINSASLVTRFANQTANNRTFTAVKLSRLNAGKDWTEGVGQNPATDGSVTWNHQKGNTVPWTSNGAANATDIDLGTTQTFDLVGVDGSATIITRDITAWVQSWVNTPANNNGMLWWGGGSSDSDSGNRYFHFGTKEDGAGPAGETNAAAPSLLIDWTPVPEPTAGLLLVAGSLPMLLRRKRMA
jgi:hypothetical protein